MCPPRSCKEMRGHDLGNFILKFSLLGSRTLSALWFQKSRQPDLTERLNKHRNLINLLGLHVLEATSKPRPSGVPACSVLT